LPGGEVVGLSSNVVVKIELKYSGTSRALDYSISLEGNPSDEGNDVGDELEFGFNDTFRPVLVGLSSSIHADEGDDEGEALIGAV
jgi:hypothetical protein